MKLERRSKIYNAQSFLTSCIKIINFDFLFHVSCDTWWVTFTTVVQYGSIRISFPFNKIDFDAKYVVGAEHKNTNTATEKNID